MTSPALVLLVIVWSGHNIQPQSMPDSECRIAAAAVGVAAHVRQERYATESSVSVYCIPQGTGADAIVNELLSPPTPEPRQALIPLPLLPPREPAGDGKTPTP